MTDAPADLLYTPQHEWISHRGDTVRVGITAFAQDALGDIVFVTLPAPGTTVTAGAPCAEVESTKSVSDVYAPVSGTVVERNESLDATPELLNRDPFGEGWMFVVQLSPGAESALDGLLDAEAYASLTAAN